jgi:hypothetical protein
MSRNQRSIHAQYPPLASAAVAALLVLSAPWTAADGLGAALVSGKPWAELRYRYEHVEQANALRNAEAST